ncbi:MAG: bifunctional 4-hydroxy-2-oxoglutarate aldolase/2-dehydro-3-deoxy-phosphogluconate aldolase [Saccharospirillum sp.]
MRYSMREILERACPVMPVLSVDDVNVAVPLARALKASGLNVLEVTLRTDTAFEVIEAMKTVDGILVGAGTVMRVEQFEALAEVRADFAISPGATPQLLEAGSRAGMPFLPAVTTVSELLSGIEAGYDAFKFFPAEASGGTAALKAFQGPLPNVVFCPTGGINATNVKEYLSLSNVTCVGGSWVVPSGALQRRDWTAIEHTAMAACREVT